MGPISRRDFLASSTLLVPGLVFAQTSSVKITVEEVVERIKQHVGVPWREHTVDGVILGDPHVAVNGIACTMMATLDVLKRAAAAGKNFVVSHETPVYLHQDKTDDIENDSVLQFKREFVKKNNMAVFHFHDHWHAFQQDGVAKGMLRQLGWEKYVSDPSNLKRLAFPGIPLAKLAQQMQAALGARTIRVIGDPDLAVHQVVTSWGFISREPGIATISKPDVEVLIGGETREWELVEYVQDSIAAGNKKALVLVGHVLSEQGGMQLCTDWLKPFVPEVSVEFVPAREPFWLPDHPVSV